MEQSKRVRFVSKQEGSVSNDTVYDCCYCRQSSTTNKKDLYNAFNTRLHFFLKSLGISENKLLCCKTCYMQVEKEELEKFWLLENWSLEYKGIFPENTHKFSDLNIIGDYCIIVDHTPNSMGKYIIISISDDHKSFVINRKK